MFKKLTSTRGTFGLYARLRTQLETRPLGSLRLHPDCPEKPFVWPPVCSDDFYFEDAMRLAARVTELRDQGGVKCIQKALSILQHLQRDVYVEKWQCIPVLPPSLTKESLQQLERRIKVEYIECFFRDYMLKNHPIDEDPQKSLEITTWLARENRHTFAPYLEWVRMEILYRTAITKDDEKAMKSALAYAERIEDDPQSPERALERVAYVRHFASMNFPGLTKASDVLPVQPENEFRAHVLIDKIKPFSWANEAANEDYIFTI